MQREADSCKRQFKLSCGSDAAMTYAASQWMAKPATAPHQSRHSRDEDVDEGECEQHIEQPAQTVVSCEGESLHCLQRDDACDGRGTPRSTSQNSARIASSARTAARKNARSKARSALILGICRRKCSLSPRTHTATAITVDDALRRLGLRCQATRHSILQVHNDRTLERHRVRWRCVLVRADKLPMHAYTSPPPLGSTPRDMVARAYFCCLVFGSMSAAPTRGWRTGAPGNTRFTAP